MRGVGGTNDRGPVAPGGAAQPLLHWLLLVCGIAALAALLPGDPAKPLSIAAGAALGTGLGQALALGRVRMWLAAFTGLNAIWVGALFLWPLMAGGLDADVMVQAYLPALLCGYLSLTERGTLASFWFPAVLWSLAILEVEPDASAIGNVASAFLLAGLGVLLLAAFWAREARRIAQWKTTAIVPLAASAGRTVLRDGPWRGLARAGAMVVIGGAVVVLTAWVAPHLRRHEALPAPSKRAPTALTGTVTNPTTGVPAKCCPEAKAPSPPALRVREYFPFAPPRRAPSLPPAPGCVECRDGVPSGGGIEGQPQGNGDLATADDPGGAGGAPAGSEPGKAIAPATRAARPRTDREEPLQVAPPASLPPRPAVSTARPARPKVAGGAPPSGAKSSAPTSGSRPAARPTPAPGEGELPFGSLLALAGSALALQLAVRPTRRWITLRHLRRPFWKESVGQRVSNLWQLALIGLRDAGWRSAPGEQPQELARRVGLDGLAACATILERARHGVRLDQADLEAMEATARSVYGLARRRVGWAARVAAWWRWPLA